MVASREGLTIGIFRVLKKLFGSSKEENDVQEKVEEKLEVTEKHEIEEQTIKVFSELDKHNGDIREEGSIQEAQESYGEGGKMTQKDESSLSISSSEIDKKIEVKVEKGASEKSLNFRNTSLEKFPRDNLNLEVPSNKVESQKIHPSSSVSGHKKAKESWLYSELAWLIEDLGDLKVSSVPMEYVLEQLKNRKLKEACVDRDGSHLLLRFTDVVYIVNLIGESTWGIHSDIGISGAFLEPSGTKVYIALNDGRIFFLDLSSKRVLSIMNSGLVRPKVFMSHNLLAFDNRKIIVLDQKLKTVFEYFMSEDIITSKLSPNGRYLIVVTKEIGKTSRIYMFDVNSGTILWVREVRSTVFDVDVDGNYISVVTHGKFPKDIYLMDLKTGRNVFQAYFEDVYVIGIFLLESAMVVLGTNVIGAWNLKGEKIVYGSYDKKILAGVPVTGNELLIITRSGWEKMKLMEVESTFDHYTLPKTETKSTSRDKGKLIKKEIEVPFKDVQQLVLNDIRYFDMDKEGRYAILASDNELYFVSRDNRTFWSKDFVTFPSSKISSISISPNGEIIGVTLSDGHLYVLNNHGVAIWDKPFRHRTYGVAVSNNNIAVVGWDSLHLFDLTGNELWKVILDSTIVTVSISEDGSRIVCGTSWAITPKIYVLDDKGSILKEIRVDNWVKEVTISPDGKYGVAHTYFGKPIFLYHFSEAGKFVCISKFSYELSHAEPLKEGVILSSGNIVEFYDLGGTKIFEKKFNSEIVKFKVLGSTLTVLTGEGLEISERWHDTVVPFNKIEKSKRASECVTKSSEEELVSEEKSDQVRHVNEIESAQICQVAEELPPTKENLDRLIKVDAPKNVQVNQLSSIEMGFYNKLFDEAYVEISLQSDEDVFFNETRIVGTVLKNERFHKIVGFRSKKQGEISIKVLIKINEHSFEKNLKINVYSKGIKDQGEVSEPQYSTLIIEEFLPVKELSEIAKKEKKSGVPLFEMHYWGARKPLIVSRAVLMGSLINLENLPWKISPTVYKSKSNAVKDNFLMILKAKENRPHEYSPPLELVLNSIIKTWGEVPTVWDPFAGGGSVPFEALRLGVNVVVGDYNPVAYLILKATLDYPRKYGWKLYEDVEKYAKYILNELKMELKQFYPKYKGLPTIAYIYAWEIICPKCDKKTPLLGMMQIVKNKNKKKYLEPVTVHDKIEFQLKTGEAQYKGNVSGGKGTCLHCGAEIKLDKLDKKLVSERMLVVVVKEKKGRSYELAKDKDVSYLKKADIQLKREWIKFYRERLIPDTSLPPSFKNTLFEKWYEAFNPRQLLLAIKYAQKARKIILELSKKDPEYAKAVGTYLSFILAKHMTRNSRSSIWVPEGETVSPIFAIKGMGTMWNYVEINPFEKVSGSLLSTIRDVLDGLKYAIEKLSNTPGVLKLYNESVRVVKFNQKFEIIIADPPYYNNVNYGEHSEIFYIWHKRIVGDLFKSESKYFNSPSVPIWEDLSVGAGKAYERKYKRLFREILLNLRDHLKDNGVLILFFNHKNQDTWNFVAESLWKTGFQILSVYPVHTENPQNVLARGKKSIFHSLIVVARKRTDNKIAHLEDIIDEVERDIFKAIEKYESYGMSSTDLIVAAMGAALSSLTKYSTITSYSYESLGTHAIEFSQKILAKYLSKTYIGSENVDNITTFYIFLWLNNLYTVEYSMANQLMKALGISEKILEQKGIIGFKEENGTKVMILNGFQRYKDIMNPQLDFLVDYVHYGMREYLNKGIKGFQNVVLSSPYSKSEILGVLKIISRPTNKSVKKGDVVRIDAKLAKEILRHLSRLGWG